VTSRGRDGRFDSLPEGQDERDRFAVKAALNELNRTCGIETAWLTTDAACAILGLSRKRIRRALYGLVVEGIVAKSIFPGTRRTILWRLVPENRRELSHAEQAYFRQLQAEADAEEQADIAAGLARQAEEALVREVTMATASNGMNDIKFALRDARRVRR
jgi:predicted ArsR family transcriptional regulator